MNAHPHVLPFRAATFHVASVAALMMLVLSGCGAEVKGPEVVPVRGTVKVGDAPVTGARVTFTPTAPKVNPAGGVTDASGNYQMFYGSRAGLPVGDYKVTISQLVTADGKPFEAKEGGLDAGQLKMQGKVKEGLPPKYSDPGKTELTFKVEAGGSKAADFTLQK
jgi:hypothetical protein